MNDDEFRTAMNLLSRPLKHSGFTAALRKDALKAKRMCSRWFNDPNIIGFGVGDRITDGRESDELAIRIHVLKKLPKSRLGTNLIPPIVSFPGLKNPLPIDVLQGDIGQPQLAMVGDGISLSGSSEFGTIGCLVQKSGSADIFAVTCRHVLDGTKGDSVEWAEFPPAPALPNPQIGTLAYKNNFLNQTGFPNLTDISLVRLNQKSVASIVRGLGLIAGIRKTPLNKGETVRLCGFGTSLSRAGAKGLCEGVVLEPYSNQIFLYEKYGELGFRDLVLCSRFTSSMDSGAAVLDSNNYLVGIHIGASSPNAAYPWSAFQPIGNVFGTFGLSLFVESESSINNTVDAHALGSSQGRPPPKVASRASAIDILARTLWGEGRGEQTQGIEAIANVVLNRVAKNKPNRFGDTVEGVCKKKLQFSCWNDNDPNLPKLLNVTDNDEAFRNCLEIARTAVNGELRDNTVGSDHYHTIAVSPNWSEGKTPVIRIGNHVFFNNIP